MKKAIYAAVAALLVAGCGKDKDLSPSGLDRNWFAVEDSSDPVDHLRYEIYSQTGIALFRNDTIGSIDRGLDALGNPYVYYEVLDVNYAITSRTEVATYELSEDDDAVIAGLELMRDRVIPILPEKLYPRCFLLVGRLDIDQKKNRKGEASAYRGMMTTAVGRLNSIKTMPEAEKKRLAAEIAAEVISVYLVNERATELEDFYAKASLRSVSTTMFTTSRRRIPAPPARFSRTGRSTGSWCTIPRTPASTTPRVRGATRPWDSAATWRPSWSRCCSATTTASGPRMRTIR